MKRLLFETMLLAMVIVFPGPAMARVDVGISIPLPPAIVFAAPPQLIVLPETYIYVVPDIDVDLFFWNGWWWRLWEGRWYRSHYYNRDWRYYKNIPSFYFDVDTGWRGYYRDNNWYGHRWNHERIPSQRLQQNWKGWQNDRHWERQGTWGVQNYQPRPPKQKQELRQQRQQQYQQRPDVQKQKQPQVQQPKQQPQEKVQQPQRQEQKHQAQRPQPQSREVQPERLQQQQREAGPQSREVQPQRSHPQQRDTGPQSREVQSERSQSQHREAPQQSESRQGKPERGEEEKHDRK